MAPQQHRLQHMRHAFTCARLCTHLKHQRHAKKKKACLVWLKKLWGVQQIARLKRFFYLPLSIKYKDLTRKSCVFVISFVQCWKLYYIYIFSTQRTTDFDKLKRNMNDGTIVFLASLLIILTWKLLLLYSFWYKIISCFKKRIYSFFQL